MKSSPYSPDKFMAFLYEKSKAEPYANASTAEEALAIGAEIREKTKKLLAIDKLPGGNYRLEKDGKALEYPDYTIQKYSFELCENLETIYYVGTSSEWDKVKKGEFWNGNSTKLKVYYSQS